MLILQGRMHATFQKYDDSEAVIEEIWGKGGFGTDFTGVRPYINSFRRVECVDY